MLLVCKKRPPALLAQLHMRSARRRAWTFCLVVAVTVSPGWSILAISATSLWNAASTESSTKGTSRSAAACAAAAFVSPDE